MMKKNKLWLYAVLSVLGAISVYIGGFVLTEEVYKMISGLFIGFGAAVFCLGIGNLIGALIISKAEYDELMHQKNIEINDERNVRIREKVGAKINRILIYVITAIVLAFGFLDVDVIIIIIISSVLLLELILAIMLTNYYSKRM